MWGLDFMTLQYSLWQLSIQLSSLFESFDEARNVLISESIRGEETIGGVEYDAKLIAVTSSIFFLPCELG